MLQVAATIQNGAAGQAFYLQASVWLAGVTMVGTPGTPTLQFSVCAEVGTQVRRAGPVMHACLLARVLNACNACARVCVHAH